MTNYTITNIGSQPQWVISVTGQYVNETSSLALALSYLATILVYGDNINYVNEPVIPVIP